MKGSPGVSTFCLALAARWPGTGRRVLVECDPAGGDLAARYGLALSPGLVSFAAARRGAQAETGAPMGSVWWHTQVLPGGLSVLVAPPGGEQTRAALASLAAAGEHPLAQAAVDPAVVIADCGRLDAGSAALSLVRAADQVLLLNDATAGGLAHLSARLEEVTGWSEQVGLLLVGEGYPDAEVARELGVPVMARIPRDPVQAAVLSGRTPPRSRLFPRATLSRAAVEIATVLATSQPLRSRSAVSPEDAHAGDADSPAVDGQNFPAATGPAMIAVPSQPLNGRRA
ncbi:MAG: hypothetical protein ABI140_03875 [Jatrophihabitantaceae bacterium]